MTIPATPPLVQTEDVRVELGGREVLRGVTAQLARGKVTALIGLNGSGKTTLLRAILKEYPYRGRIRFFCGHDHRRPDPEHIGYVPQKLNIDARLPITVKDLLALAIQPRPLFLGVSHSIQQRIEEMLDRVGARRLLQSPVAKLSGGELQRVLLGLALEPKPELLLLDEPAAGIDFKDQERFYDLIAQCNAELGVTVLLVSHELNVVLEHAHHVLCMKDGQIACEGPPGEILSGETLALTFGHGLGVYHHTHPH